MVVLAFKQGTYSKISEFLRFFTRVDHSLHRAFVALDLLRHDTLFSEAIPHNQEARRSPLDSVLHEISSFPADDLLCSEEHCTSRWDNRDNQVMIHFNTPTSPSVFEELQTEQRRTAAWFQVNALTLKVLQKTVKKEADAQVAVEELEKVTESATGKCFEGERIKAKAVALMARLVSQYRTATTESDEVKKLAADFSGIFGTFCKMWLLLLVSVFSCIILLFSFGQPGWNR